jgi:glycosyltransferase involved in cell wall biosynthesis
MGGHPTENKKDYVLKVVVTCMGAQLKIAALYSGRSLSQPVLLNELNSLIDIDLHLYRNSTKTDVELNFDHKKHIYQENKLEIKGNQPLWLNQFLLRRQWKKYLERNLSSDIDLVITMNDLGPPSVKVANKYGIPSLFFIRNLASPGQEMYSRASNHLTNFQSADFGGKIQYPFLVNNFNSYSRGLNDATKVVANSKYVAERLREDFRVDSEIVYPPITREKYLVEYNSEGCIGMVGARNEAKGVDIFFDIVESMPSENFISAGVFRNEDLKRRANSLENLHHMGFVEDMNKFYMRTKLVVVPSRCSEAFGRAAAEPMVSGIPCVVSDRGGLPEVVGETGEIVSEIDSTKAWIEAIQRALDEHNPEAQKSRVEKFSTERQGQKLASITNSVLN